MKTKMFAGLALVLGTAVFALAADGTWTGYISDSACGAKGANADHAACATKCVKEKGAKYVFVNDADKKVFAVDDQDKVAAHAGHHVTVCHSGTDALIVLTQLPFDLVVLDYFLDDMKGSELLHCLRRDGIRTPVLMP